MQHVVVEKRINEWNDGLSKAVVRGLEEGGESIVRISKAQATKYNVGSILNSAHPEPVARVPFGYVLVAAAEDFRYIFFEKGTYKRRSGKLKKSRRSTSTQRGVKAGHFLYRGLKAARLLIPEFVKRNMELHSQTWGFK